MRISTAMIFRQGTTSISELQASLVRTQSQLASGNRLTAPADDPVAAARLLVLDGAIEQNDQFQRNANMARGRLGLEEQVLTDVQNVLFRIRDLAVQANNDTQNSETRGYIAAETSEALDQLVQLANTRDAEGNFLFAGFNAKTRPFTQQGGNVNYAGDQGQRMIQISDTRRVADSDSGDAVFMNIPNGSGDFAIASASANTGTAVIGARTLNDPSQWDHGDYTVRFTAADTYDVIDSGGATIASGTYADGDSIEVRGVSFVVNGAPAAGDELQVGPSRKQDMFSTVRNFIDALSANQSPTGSAQLHNDLGNVLIDLDRSVDTVLDFRTRVGTRLQTLDSQESSNADYTLTLQAARGELQSIDYAEAVTRLNQQLTGLEAAQQSFVRIQSLSLFNLLR